MMWVFFEDENGKRDKVERNIYIYWSDAKKKAIKVLDAAEEQEYGEDAHEIMREFDEAFEKPLEQIDDLIMDTFFRRKGGIAW